MRFPSPLIPGNLILRYKRFLADVRLRKGRVVTAHCANTGRMTGCKAPGSRVYLSHQGGQHRRLAYTWEMVQVAETWVGINTLYPNRLVAEGIEAGVIRELQGYRRIRHEVRITPHTRLDLCLEGPETLCFVEVKNVTLKVGGAAAFPDAVTERGRKHLRELFRLRKKGHRAVLIFVIQRDDCTQFRPADEIDPEYGRWLRKAAQAGVEILPYAAKVNPREITLTEPLLMKL